MTIHQLNKIVNDVTNEIDFIDFQLHQQMLLIHKLRKERKFLKLKKKVYGRKIDEYYSKSSCFGTIHFSIDDLPF